VVVIYLQMFFYEAVSEAPLSGEKQVKKFAYYRIAGARFFIGSFADCDITI